jgi:hypothetical protein
MPRFAAYAVLCLVLAGCDGGEEEVIQDGGALVPNGHDITAPRLLGSQPISGAIELSIDTPLMLEFSEPMNRATVQIEVTPPVALGPPVWSREDTLVTFQPPPLRHATTYSLVVTGRDLGDLALGPTAVIFATEAAPSTTAPAIIRTSPKDGAQNVAVDAVLQVEFSKEMDPLAVVVTLDPAVNLGAAEWTDSNRVLAFPSASPFANATRYTATVAGADTSGLSVSGMRTFSFTTEAVQDTEPPSVVSTVPAAASTNVPTSVQLSVLFSEEMDKASVEAAFSVTPAVSCSYLWDSAGKRLHCLPSVLLAPGASYVATVSAAAKDLAGNALASPSSSAFSTAALPDTTPPSVVAMSPAQGAIGVDTLATMSVSFSEPMKTMETEGAFVAISRAPFGTFPVPVVGSMQWSTDGKTLTFTPGSPLLHDRMVTFWVATGAKDLAGNALPAQVSASFHTLRLGSMQIFAGAQDGYVSSIGGMSTTSNALYVGETAGGVSTRAFLSFDLSVLPASTVGITGASFHIYQSSVVNSPYALGNLVASSVNFGPSLEAADFSTPVLQTKQCSLGGFKTCGPMEETRTLSSSTANGYKSASATSKVSDDWKNRAARGNRSQYRLKFQSDGNGGAADYVTLYSANLPNNRPYLDVEYEYP